jgi:very-short-patch-repair endonuclease
MGRATVKRARTLRRNAPASERILWMLLRNRRLENLKFRRQMPLGPFVLDFVCLRHRLVVEADGPFHDAEQDAPRDAWLAAKGFRVVRIPNAEIDSSGDRAISRILDALERRRAVIKV